MATRTIVTSQPDVACDVCERRLLRGESPDTFIAAGRRLTVCELCAPRASHEGWMRESDSSRLGVAPLRPRRARSFIERLRQVGGRPPGERAPAIEPPADSEIPSPYDFLDAAPRSAEPAGEPLLVPPSGAELEGWVVDDHLAPGASASHEDPFLFSTAAPYLQEAVDAFNASEFPRRVAGVARSLGAPEITVRSAEHLSSVVRIVVAWELCWYTLRGRPR